MTKGIAARWRNIRRLYPIYLAISTSFKIGPQPPYSNLSAVSEEQEPDAIGHAERWMGEMDEHIQPHHLRQIMQQTDVAATEPKLLALVQRHASKTNRSQLDSDKLNFVLTQYLWACAPPSFRSREISIADAAEVMEPVLGTAPSEFAPWLGPLQEALEQLRRTDSVSELKDGNFVERGRELRAQLAARYFERGSLLLFAFYNFCLRQAFTRVVQNDARRVREGLEQLRQMGSDIAIRISNLPAPLTLDEIEAKIAHITSPPAGEYGIDESWRELPELCVAIENELANRRAAGAVSEDRVAQLDDRLQELLAQISSVRDELAALRKGAQPQQSGSRTVSPAAAQPEFHMEVEMPEPTAYTPPAAYTPPGEAVAAAPPTQAAPRPPAPQPPAPAAPPAAQPAAPQAHATAAAAPAATAPGAPANAIAGAVAAELLKHLNHARSVLGSAKTATGLVPIGNTAIVLSAPEIDSVMNGKDGAAQLIRQGIAVRMALVERLELARSGQQQEFASMRAAAEQTQRALDAMLKQSPRPPSDALAITSRQLNAVLRATPRK